MLTVLFILCTCLYTCFCVCARVCPCVPVLVCLHPIVASVLFHPPSVAAQLLTTEGKVKVLQTKRQNVLTRASRDKRSKVCGLRQGCRESRYTINSLAQMNWLDLLPNTPLFYIFPSSLSISPSSVSFSLLFFRGLPDIKALGIDFLILSFPPFFYLIPLCHCLPLTAQINTVSACTLE